MDSLGVANSMTGPAEAGDPPGSHVSIIMRTRDRPVLLARALSSVLAQVHSDWRIVLVNDGGARAPVDALVAEYATALAGRVTVLHRSQSAGMEAATNAALAASSGAFVCVHDDDDSWHPDYLDLLSRFLNRPEQGGFVAAICHCVVIRERIEEDCVIEEWREHGVLSPARIDYVAMLHENQFPPISLMLRRSVVDAAGGFNEAMLVLGDWDYNLRVLRIGEIAVLPRVLSYYHLRQPDDTSAYGNTIVTHRAGHLSARALYRNGMMRRLAQEQPAALAVIQALSAEGEANRAAAQAAIEHSRHILLTRSWESETWDTGRHSDLRDRLLRVETELAEIRAALGAIRQVTDMVARLLRPLRGARRRAIRLVQKAP